jgi:hypothetical protein
MVYCLMKYWKLNQENNAIALKMFSKKISLKDYQKSKNETFINHINSMCFSNADWNVMQKANDRK